jgi:hypothetical protein
MVSSFMNRGTRTLPDGRRMVPPAVRNAGPILEVLGGLDLKGRLLEIASGSGLHAAEMAGKLGLDWQPTDVDPANFPSVHAWAAVAGGRVRNPVLLDARVPGWAARMGQWDAVLVVNLLHLIPEPAALVVLAEAAAALVPWGWLCIYGPFLRDGKTTSPGDTAFEAMLRAEDPAVGYKDLGWVRDQLAKLGLQARTVEMPANNVMLVAQRQVGISTQPQKAG